jgi:hypothetical protein
MNKLLFEDQMKKLSIEEREGLSWRLREEEDRVRQLLSPIENQLVWIRKTATTIVVLLLVIIYLLWVKH